MTTPAGAQGWHPVDLEDDVDVLREELRACVVEIDRLKAALAEAGRTYEKAVVNVGCDCQERGYCDAETRCVCLLCAAIDAVQAVRG